MKYVQKNKITPSIKILVCYHKPARLYKSDVFVPIHAGRALAKQSGILSSAEQNWMTTHLIGDDTGENISNLNSHFGELTAIYWAWKNYDKLGNPDYIGLEHYRRVFFPADIRVAVHYDITAPLIHISPQETIAQQFVQGHNSDDLFTALDLLAKKHPVYTETIQKYLDQHSSYFFNMFIMKKELFFEYCSVLFPTLLETHAHIDYSCYTAYNQRMPGFIGERLTHLFIAQKASSCKIHSCRVVFQETPPSDVSACGLGGTIVRLGLLFQGCRCHLLSWLTWGRTRKHYQAKQQNYYARWSTPRL